MHPRRWHGERTYSKMSNNVPTKNQANRDITRLLGHPLGTLRDFPMWAVWNHLGQYKTFSRNIDKLFWRRWKKFLRAHCARLLSAPVLTWVLLSCRKICLPSASRPVFLTPSPLVTLVDLSEDVRICSLRHYEGHWEHYRDFFWDISLIGHFHGGKFWEWLLFPRSSRALRVLATSKFCYSEGMSVFSQMPIEKQFPRCAIEH